MTSTVLRLNPEPVSTSTLGQDSTKNEQEAAEADSHRVASSTLQGCRQGCYRQAVPLSEERRRLSGRYDQASATTRR